MNKDKVIRNLKERNDSLNNQYRLKEIRCVHLEQTTKDLEKEIESQKRVINGMIDNEKQYCLEINRLNNIINETEKWLESEIKRLNDIRKGKGSKIKPYGEEYNHYSTMISGYIYCLDKIKELKREQK